MYMYIRMYMYIHVCMYMYVEKNATICKICEPQSDKTTCHTFMVCLWICARSVGEYGTAALFAKRAAIQQIRIFMAKSAAIQGLWRFTRRRTAARPSK